MTNQAKLLFLPVGEKESKLLEKWYEDLNKLLDEFQNDNDLCKAQMAFLIYRLAQDCSTNVTEDDMIELAKRWPILKEHLEKSGVKFPDTAKMEYINKEENKRV